MNMTKEKNFSNKAFSTKKSDKYRVLEEDDLIELKQMHEKIKTSNYRQKFHIQALTGLLNDPNGFSYIDGVWHLFYQWFPFDAIHGMKHWYHVSSTDLCTWKNQGNALKPDMIYDNHGVYSGSAIAVDSNLLLFYTANHRDEQFKRHPYQCMAILDADQLITKYKKPLISPDSNYTEHQRDPKIFYDEITQNFYLLIGAQNKQLKGRILVYSLSKEARKKDIYSQLSKDWVLCGELKIKGYEAFGYMWECPDLIRFEEADMLLFCPQGLAPEGNRFQNVHQNGYLIGKMDFETLEFSVYREFEEIDHGFDFYACQSANTLKIISGDMLQYVEQEKQKVSIGWLGLPDSNYPSDSQGWSGCLSIPRELELISNQLYQRPVASLKKLRNKKTHFELSKNHTLEAKPMEMELKDLKNTSIKFLIFKKNDKNIDDSRFEIMYDKNSGFFSISRDNVHHVLFEQSCEQKHNQDHEQSDTKRTLYLEAGLHSLQIFIDRSSIELFINEGEFTLSSRVFPTQEENMIYIRSEHEITFDTWELSAISEEEFKL